MKLIRYSEVEPRHFDNESVRGLAGRVVVGKADGAKNFCMRVFEISPGGHTPFHKHEWEHEIFIHAGEGVTYRNGNWADVAAGTVLFIPGEEEHQIKNTGREPLIIVCLIPSGVQEL